MLDRENSSPRKRIVDFGFREVSYQDGKEGSVQIKTQYFESPMFRSETSDCLNQT